MFSIVRDPAQQRLDDGNVTVRFRTIDGGCLLYLLLIAILLSMKLGSKVLVVEDHRQSAVWLTTLLVEAGYVVVGPVGSAPDALTKIAEHALDAALLDVNLGGDERVYSVADVLAALHIPFVFMSGLSPNLVPPKYRDRPYLAKPYGHSDVLAALGTAVPAEAGPPEPAPPS